MSGFIFCSNFVIIMKKLHLSIIIIAAVLAAGCTADVDAVNERLDALESRMEAVETVLEAYESGLTISDITALEDGTGYTITFSDGSTVEIKHDSDGAAGAGITVEERDDSVVFTLPDGRVITIPKQAALSLQLEEKDLVAINPNSSRDIRYTISGASGTVTIEVITSSDIRAKAVPDADSPLTGVIRIETGLAIDEYSKAVILVSDGSRVIMRAMTFEEPGLQINDNSIKTVGADGGEVTLEYLSNLSVEVIIPDAAVSWISVSPQTRAMTPGTVTLLVSRNAGAQRTATVTLRSTYGDLSIDYTIEQEAASDSDPDIITFNDPNFLNAILTRNSDVDTDGDGRISIAEAEACTSLDVSESSISDMSEIKYFTNLTELDCYSNQLTHLEVSNNTQLTWLSCSYNQLTQLDVSNNTQLTYLFCGNNQLTSLDVSSNTQLGRLYCDVNQLTYLDVSHNAQLTSLCCSINQLTSLDVSHNAQLNDLVCPGNHLTKLDVSHNAQLTYLDCGFNEIASLDININARLVYLDCYGNNLTTLDVSSNAQLECLLCFNNQLTTLDVSNNAQLTSLFCYSNQLTHLDVSNNLDLTDFKCYNNPLEELILAREHESAEWYSTVYDEYSSVLTFNAQ